MKRTLYAAYGSNLNFEQMTMRCPTAKVVAKSWLHDYCLVFQGSLYNAHANVIPEEGRDVPLLIWDIGPMDEAGLDRYEGVSGGYYTKERKEVEVDGEMREVLIYVMTPHNYGIPSDGYLATITQGYKDFRLPMAELNRAVIHAQDEVRRMRGGKIYGR